MNTHRNKGVSGFQGGNHPLLGSLGRPIPSRNRTAPKSDFSVRGIPDPGKVLLVNLAKGKIGETNAALLGALLLSGLQVAAHSRAETVDFYASGHDALWVSFDLHPLEAGSHTLRFEGRGLSPRRRTQAQPMNAFGMTYLLPLRLEDMEGYGRVLAELKQKEK